MLRVLMITSPYEPACLGGVVKSLADLSRSLVRLGHKVTVYATDSDGRSCMAVPTNRPVDVGGVEVYYFHTPMPGKFQYSKMLDFACRRSVGEFDVVNIASIWGYPGIPAAREASRLGVPYVISPHGTLTPEALSYKRFRKWLFLRAFGEEIFRSAAAVHYTSSLERSKSQVFKAYSPSFVIPNGVNVDSLRGRFSSRDAKRALGLEDEDFAVGFLGRLHRIKALDVLITAISHAVRAGDRHIRLLLAGPDDGAEGQLKRLVEEKGLRGNVRFIGPVDRERTVQFLSGLDLFALVSWTENFGNAAAEAMAVGVPVLVSENAGICDDVAQTDSGWVLPVDAVAIADALGQIKASPAQREQRGRNAKSCAFDRFERGRVAQLMATAYQDVISGKRSTACMWNS